MNQSSTIKLWNFYLSFFQRQHFLLIISVILSCFQSLVVLPNMYLARAAFDWAIPNKSWGALLQVGVGMLLLSLLSAFVALSNRYLTLKIIKKAILRMRLKLLGKLLTLPRQAHRQGDYMHWHTTIVQDTERLDIMSNNSLTVLLPSIVTTVCLVALLWHWNPWLLALMAVISPLAFIYNYFARRKLKYNTPLYLQAFEKFSKGIHFIIRSLDLIHLQAGLQWEYLRQKEVIEHLDHQGRRVAWLNGAYTLTQSNLITMGKLILLVGGGWAVINQTVTIGELIGFYIASNLLQTALQSILGTVPVLISGQASLENLYNFMHHPLEQPYCGQMQIQWQGQLTLTNITFAHSDTPLIKHLDLDIRPGMTIVILGPNGCGKSTLIDLILGFYRPNAGTISVDQYAYEAIDLNNLRQQMGVVRQENFFFAGTIWENLTYGLENPQQEEVESMVKVAMADEFIAKLPHGYQTYIGEDGNLLSGGQRQRLALARSLLRHPKLLILDEPTNHLDQFAIADLLVNLKKLSPRPGMVIVSHNLQLTEQADHVLQMQGGKLVSLVSHI